MIKTDKENAKKDSFTVVMIVQTVICGILITFMFVSASSDGKFASFMREEYAKLMTGDIVAEDLAEAFKTVREYAAVYSDNDEITQEVTEKNTYEAVFNEMVITETESESIQIGGGADLEFSSLETLEGVSFDEYTLDVPFIVPIENYEITSLFGYRTSPISGKAGIHTGLDMAADYGESIYASSAGKVVDSAYDSSYGYYVKIQHSDNIVTIYAHCSALCVNAGEIVEQGDLIAKVGSTGDSTGNHLHFEMRKDNIRINPEYALFGS